MDVSDGDLPSQGVLKGHHVFGKTHPFGLGTLGWWRRLVERPLGSAPSCSGPAPPLFPEPPGPRTLVLVLDGKAENVARPEAGAVVHTAVEKWVCIRVRDVQNLARGRHVARDALVGRDADLIALPGQGWRREEVGGRSESGPSTIGPAPQSPLRTPGPQDHGHTLPPQGPASPHHPPRPHRTPWPPARSDPAGTQSICGEMALVHRALTPLSRHPSPATPQISRLEAKPGF